ncbi:hypothetical protein F511_31908 [Dorcoceras hygrometricum]|uniref:Uncharacterized protein n=1 Tax=Dorcoceras hygrometricum TaxID=472368 RepID=A0A2Z7D174_9LAMI|nr:hypothetical protein F511_31908 [Dorcoceras hygrometricum]
MESTFLPSTLKLPHKQPLSFHPSNRRTKRLVLKKFVHAKLGGSEDKDAGKSSVDGNMIILQMRIKKLKALETASKERVASSSSDPEEWEKKSFTTHHENVYEILEVLRSYMLKTKPSVALGMLALFAMSVTLSSPVAVDNVLKVLKGLLSGCHVCIDIHF